jgi:uncharacterized protein (DUF362 family)
MKNFTRRHFLKAVGSGAVCFLSGLTLFCEKKTPIIKADVFIAKVPEYNYNIADAIREGFIELGIFPQEIKEKRILLKPNLVETHSDAIHINTNPSVVRGAIEAFKSFGASEIFVAEGPGHCRDSFRLVEESGISDVLVEDKIRFIDLNYDDIFTVPNVSKYSRLKELNLPKTLAKVDWVVSMPKMKTHHWTGVTLSMKNMFGIMPGSYYGWPKNVLHWAGINESILDINSSFKSSLAIVDGIVGMEGDGPIMGDPIKASTMVIGRNLPAVDATCARIMGINPEKVPYLKASEGNLGTIRKNNILQRGETIENVQKQFALLDTIPAHKDLRLKNILM